MSAHSSSSQGRRRISILAFADRTRLFVAAVDRAILRICWAERLADQEKHRAMGRRSQFDHEEALDIALRLFCLRGYEGTSIADLEAAIGVSRPSLYGVFGCKAELFHRAVGRYTEQFSAVFHRALEAATARDVVEHLIRGVACAVTEPDMPPGSLLVTGALACSPDNERARASVLMQRRKLKRMLARRLFLARAHGELPSRTYCKALTCYIVTLCDGMALQAQSGASRPSLLAISKFALAIIPAFDSASKASATKKELVGARAGSEGAGRPGHEHTPS